MPISHDVKDLSLAESGRRRIDWAARQMPVVTAIGDEFLQRRPLQHVQIAACLHVTTETACLISALKAGGASVRLCASNPLSTQDDVAAALVVDAEIPVFAIRGEDESTYFRHIEQVLEVEPHITMDDGADLVTTLHRKWPEVADRVRGGTEETTTGVIRLRAMARTNELRYPVIAVNDALTKHLFDNRYGTGQSAIDGILRATNMLLAGKTFVVAGYGWCSRGIAMRADGLGAHVIVTEVDPVRALEAWMDGYRVMPMMLAAPLGDLFVTATGDLHVIDQVHMQQMKDGAVMANSGHFDVEINVAALEQLAVAVDEPRDHVRRYTLADGRKLVLLAAGRLVNLAAAEGHPSAVMDMSFANQALCVNRLAETTRPLPAGVHRVPEQIDTDVARRKLVAEGLQIDVLTEQQQRYLQSWTTGT